jgi:SAM-dependent methyltransferase
MTAQEREFLFPEEAISHAWFGVKHICMASTVKKALIDRPSVSILEVGSWIGASTLLWAEAVKRYASDAGRAESSIECVDSWLPILSSEELDKPHYARFAAVGRSGLAYKLYRHNAALETERYGVPISHRKGRSDELLCEIESESKDIAFIDAGHYHDDVAHDVEEAKRIVKVGGYICGDDYNLRYDDIDVAAAWENRNRDVAVDPATGGHFHPGVTLAVGTAFENVSAANGFWIVRKTENGFVDSQISIDDAFIPSFLSKEQQDHFSDDIADLIRRSRRGADARKEPT